MTKYKMNNDNGSTTGSQITLTSYMIGENPETDDENSTKYNTEPKKGISTVLGPPPRQVHPAQAHHLLVQRQTHAEGVAQG
jgi:hypothetical protein